MWMGDLDPFAVTRSSLGTHIMYSSQRHSRIKSQVYSDCASGCECSYLAETVVLVKFVGIGFEVNCRRT